MNGPPGTGKTTLLIKRTPRIITEENAPQSHEQALRRWREARAVFNKVLARCEALLRQLDQINSLADLIPELVAAHMSTLETFDKIRADLPRATVAFQQAADTHRAARQFSDAAASHAKLQRDSRPGLLAWLFRTRRFRTWQQAYDQALGKGRFGY